MSEVSAELPFDGVEAAIVGMNELRESETLPRVRLPSGDEAWFVGQYDDVRKVLGDSRFSRDLSAPGCPRMTEEGDFSSNPGTMVGLEGAEHRQRRRPVQQYLSQSRIAGFRPDITEVAQELADDLRDKATRTGDLLSEFTHPFAGRCMSHLLGVPEEFRDLFRVQGIPLAHPDQHEKEEIEAAFVAVNEVAEKIIADKKVNPGTDLLDVLIAEAQAGTLTEWDVQVSVYELMFAGFLTTGSVLASCVYELLREPGRRQQVMSGGDALPEFVDEVVRLYSPVDTAFLRVATADTEVHGQRIRKGDGVIAGLVPANRDPRCYADPEDFDAGRWIDSSMPRHLGYGHGAHHCVGAPLARAQLEIALTVLDRTLPDLALVDAGAPLVWDHSMFERSIRRLDASW